MTSEIVLMNRQAVAMAADSAVTISGPNYLKTYQSVDKLFPLVTDQPVGVMIYNNAELMGMPWETIISIYRDQAQGRNLDSVDAYARDFIAFLNGNTDLFPQDHQDKEFFKHIAVVMSLIASDFDYYVAQFTAAQAGSLRDHVSAIFEFVVAQLHDDYQINLDDSPREDLPAFPKGTGDQLRRRYGGPIADIIDSLILALRQDHPALSVSEGTRRQLEEIAVLSVVKDAFFEHYTGVVFAGFGARETFPSMRSYLTSTVVLGTVKNRQDRTAAVTAESGPVIQPFAQDRMIRTFLTGMDQGLRYFLFGQTLRLATTLVSDVVQQTPGLSEEQRQRLASDYSEGDLGRSIQAFFGSIDEYSYLSHTGPILRAIGSLPKKELGETAASLIKLNGFQQKVMHSVETVGGPVSLATITRNEGLVMGKEKAEL
ncbi:hypothetical protein PB2503_08549 [Parvularcula bermudensis HTCC2503]|uniref:Uncharacterized protein n=1 Tax=Parvularcula bermudensis (strain ATCC BAA-594 / HTCC2503 / KCTC 12087) TaxID=314260 RepID=E0TBP4_PARBH|nr:hypothetical protein [Parvularcula bermudensis]ADM09765.1 hypothetical protein PB2503_08549 [Parvularcula bermudensis HTCC2503]